MSHILVGVLLSSMLSFPLCYSLKSAAQDQTKLSASTCKQFKNKQSLVYKYAEIILFNYTWK